LGEGEPVSDYEAIGMARFIRQALIVLSLFSRHALSQLST
jgi:hypothetical protein